MEHNRRFLFSSIFVLLFDLVLFVSAFFLYYFLEFILAVLFSTCITGLRGWHTIRWSHSGPCGFVLSLIFTFFYDTLG